MKKIITSVAVSTLLVAGSFGQVLASSDMNMEGMGNQNMGNMNSMTNMSGMKGMNGMSGMMSPEIMKKRKALMDKISASLDEEGKKELNIMKGNHMKDMMNFKKKFNGEHDSDESKIAKDEMKKKHFADLKNILSSNIELYNELSKEMESIMDEMEKEMHSKNEGKSGMNSMNGMSGMNGMKSENNGMGGMNGIKKRMFSFKTQTKMDILVNKFIGKVNRLNKEVKNEKINIIFTKIDNAKDKFEKSKSGDALIKINSILDYLKESISEKSGISFISNMNGNKGMGKMNGMSGMNNGGETFSTSVEGLPEAKPSQLVILKDGDTYKMNASAVKQEVGNRYIKRLAYNGMIPGPLLQIEKGGKIKLEFTNNLEIETTLHPHGLRLNDSKFDGLPTTMGGEQIPMKPGESFTYELDFPDTGVFWYHPHIREDYTQEMGLYGNFSVTEKDFWNNVDVEEFMILDDFSTDDVFYKEKVNKTLMGRFGNIMMINNDENYNLNVKQYETARLYLTNVANTRTFDFGIYKDGKKIDLKLVGGDIGRIEKEEMIKTQIIAPAERYIVEARFDDAGEYVIKSRDRVLGKIIVEKSDKIIKQNVFGSTLREDNTSYKFLRDNFDKFLNQKVDKKLSLTIGMQGSEGSMGSMQMDNTEVDTDEIEWEDTMAPMNKMSSDKMMEWKMVDTDTGKENLDIDWKFKKGDFVKVEIYNDPTSAHPMQHPIHFHGQRFVVLTRDGKVQKNLQWKDVSLIKNGERVEILIEMTNVGNWMSHCHIAEHLQSGMMMTFQVEE